MLGGWFWICDVLDYFIHKYRRDREAVDQAIVDAQAGVGMPASLWTQDGVATQVVKGNQVSAVSQDAGSKVERNVLDIPFDGYGEDAIEKEWIPI